MEEPPSNPEPNETPSPRSPESHAPEQQSPELNLLAPPPPSSSDRLHNIFFSEDGLRSGWRFLLYLVLFGAFAFTFGRVAEYVVHHLPHKPAPIWSNLVGEALALLAAVTAAFVMARIEKRSFDDYGLPKKGAFGRSFWIGTVWGIAGITLLLLLISAAGDFSFGGIVLHGIRILKFAAFWGVVFLVVGLFEEFLFRGYTLFTLTQGIGFWPAAILLSTAFGAVHLGNRGEALLGALAAGLIGLFFCLTLRRTGTLWFAVGFHAAWDWGESYLYSVPDSGEVSPGHLLSSSFHGNRWITGGTVGPEGSILVLVIIALLWVAFDRLYPSVKYPVQREAHDHV